MISKEAGLRGSEKDLWGRKASMGMRRVCEEGEEGRVAQKKKHDDDKAPRNEGGCGVEHGWLDR